MIIKSPTANYIPILPSYSESGNITYTISNTAPPKKGSIAPTIPTGVAQAKASSINYSKTEGKILATITNGYNSIASTVSKQYSVGDILEFGNEQVDVSIRQEFTQLDTNYDINPIDYKKLGLTDADIQMILAAGNAENDKIRKTLNEKNSEYNNTKNNIVIVQGEINEIDKTLLALSLLDESHVGEIINKLRIKKETLSNSISELNVNLDSLYSEILDLTDKARNIGVIVK